MPIPPFETILQKMRGLIYRKVEKKQPGLYVALLFPIMFVFILTFIGSRLVSAFVPNVYLFEINGVRVHHFTYGIFILIISGYLALVFSGPRAKYLISLLHGFGLGLAFDEFGMWLQLRGDHIARQSYDGILVITGLFLLVISAAPGIRMLKKLLPLKKPKH